MHTFCMQKTLTTNIKWTSGKIVITINILLYINNKKITFLKEECKLIVSYNDWGVRRVSFKHGCGKYNLRLALLFPSVCLHQTDLSLSLSLWMEGVVSPYTNTIRLVVYLTQKLCHFLMEVFMVPVSDF